MDIACAVEGDMFMKSLVFNDLAVIWLRKSHICIEIKRRNSYFWGEMKSKLDERSFLAE